MMKLAIEVSLLFLLCFATMGVALVHGITVAGVSQGNVFEYDMVSHYDSIYTDTAPAELVELNQTQWIRVTVTGVSGVQISTRTVTHYKNGTETNSDGSCDLETGENSGGPPFIGANLGKGSLINPSASERWYVNETAVRTYRDGTRETNHLLLQSVQNFSDVGEVYLTYDYYFDKTTGALVEYTSEVYYSGVTSTTTSKIISSNVWVIPEFPSLIILSLFMMMTLFVAGAAKKRLSHRLP
jgi:hypothetical protein